MAAGATGTRPPRPTKPPLVLFRDPPRPDSGTLHNVADATAYPTTSADSALDVAPHVALGPYGTILDIPPQAPEASSLSQWLARPWLDRGYTAHLYRLGSSSIRSMREFHNDLDLLAPRLDRAVATTASAPELTLPRPSRWPTSSTPQTARPPSAIYDDSQAGSPPASPQMDAGSPGLVLVPESPPTTPYRNAPSRSTSPAWSAIPDSQPDC